MSETKEIINKLASSKCFLCGVCCKKFRVVVDIDEGRFLAKMMKLDWNEFLDNYLDAYYVATDRFLIRQVNDSCIFLRQVDSKKALCSINDFKPSSCIKWAADISNTECKKGLKQVWKLEVTPEGEIAGSKKNIKDLISFIESIT
jgi:Fe-S-cluster containining protein